MSWFGLSPAVFAAGALALASAAVLLHLLRVRLRRVEVDTLLFFRLAGTVRQPRALPGRPSRLWSLLLALLAFLAAWTALADPRADASAPSRVVVIEPAPDDAAGTLMAARVAAARTLVAQGLGPRGRVLAATSPPGVLLLADEPVDLLAERVAALPAGASDVGGRDAFAAVAGAATAADEWIWLGASPVPWRGGQAVVAVQPAHAGDAVWRSLRWERLDEQQFELVAQQVFESTATAELLVGEQVVATAVLQAGVGQARLGPVAGDAAVRLRLTTTAGIHDLSLPAPGRQRLRVALAGALPEPASRALAALLAIDPDLHTVPLAEADVVIAAADADDPRPRLVITPGVESKPRRAQMAGSSPVALSLRDRVREAAAALPPLAEAAVWVRDAVAQDALVAATVDGAGRARVHAVDWLLAPETHADVPLLLSAALRQLGCWPRTALATVQQPFELAAGLPGAWRVDGLAVQPVAGAIHHAFTTPGVRRVTTPTGAIDVHVVAASGQGALAVVADPLPERSFAGAGSWTPWLLLLLLAAVAADAFFYHRGRLP